MDFKLCALLIISAQIYSTLSLPPCTCARNSKPVCGSDGVEYGNECMLECAKYETGTNITIVKEGPCEGSLQEGCVCPDLYAPVCASNGKTYANECELNCENALLQSSIKIEHTGRCKTAPEPETVCPLIESPVCGSDGNTYSNSCMLNAATKNNSGLSVAHEGPCKDSIRVKDI